MDVKAEKFTIRIGYEGQGAKYTPAYATDKRGAIAEAKGLAKGARRQGIGNVSVLNEADETVWEKLY